MALQHFGAIPDGYLKVDISWVVTGGCPPFYGDIGGGYFVPGTRYWMHEIRSEAGAYTDAIWAPLCEPQTHRNPILVTYNLLLSDSAGNRVNVPGVAEVTVLYC